jgi:uncharacterized protein
LSLEQSIQVQRPTPVADRVTQGFWDSLKDTGQLHIQYCTECDRYQHFPEAACTSCGHSEHLTYKAVSGRGEVYTYVVTHQTRIPSLVQDVPYVIAWVELPEQAGLRVVANIRNIQPSDVVIGLPVKLLLEHRDGIVIPQFEPVG